MTSRVRIHPGVVTTMPFSYAFDASRDPFDEVRDPFDAWRDRERGLDSRDIGARLRSRLSSFREKVAAGRAPEISPRVLGSQLLSREVPVWEIETMDGSDASLSRTGEAAAMNRLGEAEPLMRRAMEILDNSLGPEHPTTLMVRRNQIALILLATISAGAPDGDDDPGGSEAL